MIYAGVLVGMYTLHLMLKMHWITTGIVTVYMLLRVREHRRLYRQSNEQKLRFGEVTDYLDTVLYAFLKEGKVETALEDTQAALVDGPMREAVADALDHMHMTFDESNVMTDALHFIEKQYPCHRVKAVHDFFMHVENYGGDATKPVELLLADKNQWQKCIQLEQKQRRKMFADIVMSIAASLIICCIILYLPVMNIDISSNIISQVLTIVVLILDDMILSRAQKYLAVDWLVIDNEDEKQQRQRLKRYMEYDRHKEIRLSFLLALLAMLVTVVCLIRNRQPLAAIGMVLALIMANQHRIGRMLSVKNLKKSIQRAFPGWLMDIILLLQSENVQVALTKSQESVPTVLAHEVEHLVDRIEMEPESAEPYHIFLWDFQIPEVHSAMSMLYSISMGSSNRADQQISELIGRNLAMLDAAERERLSNLSSGMYLLFLAPVMTASLKLVTDMAIFMLTFLMNGNLAVMS